MGTLRGMKIPMFDYHFTNVLDTIQRDKILPLTKATLQKDMKLNIMRTEARGANGHVISAKAKGNKVEDIAIKIVTNKNISDGERGFWPRLHHSNILPMLQYDYLQPLNVHIFTSPLLGCNLERVLNENFYLKYEKTFLEIARKWLREILEAVNYLHKKGLSHLGIKPTSVLISCDLKAILCDFHYLDKTDKQIRNCRYGVPFHERPPEVCKAPSEIETIESNTIAFDIWSIGILALKLFTGDCAKKKIPQVYQGWCEDVYPYLFKKLQKKRFTRKCRKAFPACKVEGETADCMINFVTFCLRMCPADRPCVEALMRHRYSDGRGQMMKPESVWLKKGKVSKYISSAENVNFETTQQTTESTMTMEISDWKISPAGDTVKESAPQDVQIQHEIDLNLSPKNIAKSLETPKKTKKGRLSKIRRWFREKTCAARKFFSL